MQNFCTAVKPNYRELYLDCRYTVYSDSYMIETNQKNGYCAFVKFDSRKWLDNHLILLIDFRGELQEWPYKGN